MSTIWGFDRIEKKLYRGVAAANNTNKKLTFRNYPPVTDCITKIDNAQVDDAQRNDVV